MDFAGAYTWEHIRFLLEGLGVTLKVAVIAIVLSFLIGCLLGIVRYTKLPVISQLTALCVEIIRNLPLLLIIFFAFFALPEVGIKLSVQNAAILALTVFEAAMISEIVRSGVKSIDQGQIEAARSSGLGYTQTLWHITLPQALRRMMPPMVSQFISLLKDTSLAVVISLGELMHHAQIINGQNVNFIIPILLLAAIIYFVVNYTLSIVARRLEARQV
ncbi:amino acid ABC transporter permease [Paenibacillus xerothermodurans]|uniref:Amino acid ABC transporter permease n=1 Tax=Paenibacillus xerothermodurans TaxID=1977292 RepID=A0A2W1NY50_PAEXE|nr:amino acid ABC transporter permease [Paenibacillus xerothermodurans]PZE19788.1 amino acid ABC transporter permease [Paenibacillus xerothermodurans]